MAEPVHAMMGEPDLSHLTEEERKIIQNVMMRQKQEEEKENEIMRRKQDEVKVLEETIRVRSEQQRKAGIELDATCQICLKTKFADGIGHMCNYCAVRCCARCGGKVSLRSNKVIWVCILCRKKQELLIKTGQWIHSGMVPTGEGVVMKPEDLGLVPGPSLDKRPKLERGSSYEQPPILRRHEKEREEMIMRPPPMRARSFDSADEQMSMGGDPFRMDPRHDWGRTRIMEPPMGHYQQPQDYREMEYEMQQPPTPRGRLGSEYGEERDVVRDLDPHQHLDTGAMMRRQKMEAVGRNDSLSSDQSESMRPPPPKPHKHKRGKKQRQQSLSSSDDEIRSTPDCTSCEDQELESESVSEKGEGESVAEIRKEEEILDAKIKKFLAHPVSWAPSKDGGKMIGHMILKKDQGGGAPASSSATILGLKVTGGKILQFGKLGAIIEKVKKGSIADTVGNLKPGDEVIEWNGRSLTGKTFEEVYDIIADSRQEPQVELIVSRPISEQQVRREGSARRYTYTGVSQCEPLDTRKLSEGGRFDHRDRRPSVTITSPSSPDIMRPHSPHLGGRIQLKLWYDSSSAQLVVTVMGAMDLPPRPNGQPRNPYAKMLLLPDKSEKSKRRTKTLANTLEPKWRQNFVYSSLRRIDLKNRSLEVTVWDYDRYATNDFLGEAIIDLSASPIDNETYSYHLISAHEESYSTSSKRGPYMDVESCSVASTDHLSPPSTTSRLSDSDISDYDDRLQDRRITDTASISSIGSSVSPPPDAESIERQSRRDTDLSPQGRGRNSAMILRADPHSRKREMDAGRSSRQRSQSAAPLDSPHDHGHLSRSRSKSPRRSHDHSRSLSPPEARSPLEGRGTSGGRARSETATPLGSPKKRQLPQIPGMTDSRDRYAGDRSQGRLKQRMDSYQQRPYQQGDHGIGKLMRKLHLSPFRERRKKKKGKDGEGDDSEAKSIKDDKSDLDEDSKSTQSEKMSRKEKREIAKRNKKEKKKLEKQQKKEKKLKAKQKKMEKKEMAKQNKKEAAKEKTKAKKQNKKKDDSSQSESYDDSSNSDASSSSSAMSTPYGRSRGGTARPVRSPDREGLEFGDSDIESVISATSALSTQSERVRSSRRIGSEFVHKPEGGFDDGRRSGHLGGSYSGEITVDDKTDYGNCIM